MEYFGILEAQEINYDPKNVNFKLYIGDFTKRFWNADLLIPINLGDTLKILSYNRKIVFSGIVKYSEIKNGKILGEDKSISPEHFLKFFHNQYLGILIKN